MGKTLVAIFLILTCSRAFAGESLKFDFFQRLAFAFQEPRFCEKIDPSAEGGAGFNPRGYQHWYLQSKCYFDFAQQFKRWELCSKVKSTGNRLFTDGSKISKDECLKRMPRSEGGPFQTFVTEEEIPLLEKAGYKYEALTRFRTEEEAETKMNEEEDLRMLKEKAINKAYSTALKSPDFVTKVKGFPAEQISAKERLPTQMEYFFYIVGVDTGSTDLCEKIALNALVLPSLMPNIQCSWFDPRNGCFQNAAIKSNNPKICARLKTHAALENPYPTQSQCEKHVIEKLNFGSAVGQICNGTLGGYETLELMLPKLGYPIILEADNSTKQRALKILIEELSQSFAFISKVAALSEAKTDSVLRRPTESEYLFFVVGNVNANIQLCEKISPFAETTLDNGILFKLRSSCIRDVASKKRDPSLCNRIPEPPSDKKYEWISPKGCQMAAKKGGSFGETPVFDDESMILSLESILAKLKHPLEYKTGALRQLKPSKANAETYSRFLTYLMREAPLAERAQFVEKMLKLN